VIQCADARWWNAPAGEWKSSWLWLICGQDGISYAPCTEEEIQSMNDRQAEAERRAVESARIGLHAAVLKDSMRRQRAALLTIVGIYEERAARKQYDLLGDGSI
jgi:hypothetical protein